MDAAGIAAPTEFHGGSSDRSAVSSGEPRTLTGKPPRTRTPSRIPEYANDVLARRAWTQAAYSVYDPVLFEMLEVDAREFAVCTGWVRGRKRGRAWADRGGTSRCGANARA